MSLNEAIGEGANKNDKNVTGSWRKGGFFKNLVMKSLANMENRKMSSNKLINLAKEISRLNVENINWFHHEAQKKES